MTNLQKKFLLSLAFLLFGIPSICQSYDILIKGGHVIDPKNDRDGVMDIAVFGDTIVKVGVNIPEVEGKLVISARGLYVVPGILDIHGHIFHGTESGAYLSNGLTALPPDGFTFRSGVTTIVDAGGAGWRNFRTFKEQTIDESKTRVLSFLNIVGSGMKGGVMEQNMGDMDPKLTAIVARQNPGVIVGIKLAHYGGFEWGPTERAVEAGKQAHIPVMIDFGRSNPELSLEELLIKKLRPGDIFTHVYAHVGGRTPIVDSLGRLGMFVLEAQKRGVVMDVGHGGGSFTFEQAVPAIKQGLIPNTISTDLHTGSMNGGMKDQLNLMSKLLNLDMSLTQVVEASTWTPAQVIQRTDLGHLSVGAVADIAILALRSGDFGFIDTENKVMKGKQKLECELTLRAGEVVYDLNGISKSPWKPEN